MVWAACADLHITPLQQVTTGDTVIANPRYARDIQPVWTRSCAIAGACHLGPSGQNNLVLDSGVSYQNLVNVVAVQPSRSGVTMMRVLPTKPDSSFLVAMLLGDPAKRFNASRMPLGADTLSSALVQTIKNWVMNGAPNN